VNKQALARDWAGFSAALGNKELLKLDRAGIGYRVPVPGAMVEGDRVKTALPYPGLALEYFDGEQWLPLTDGVAPEAVQSLRSKSADGKRVGRAVALDVSTDLSAQ
jgi:hexosaminidase